MNVLVFDSSADIMHVTLGNDSDAVDSRTVKTTEHSYNSAFLVSTIADTLRQNSLRMSDINLIGVNIGPGSFTGLRASVTVARVIAQQLGIPAVGVPSMQIYSMLNNTGKNAFCLMDARRGMAYAGIYNKNAEPVLEPCVMEYEKALAMVREGDYFTVCDARTVKKVGNCVNFEECDAGFGEFLLKLTVKNQAPGCAWARLKPLYIQSPPIHGLKQ